MQHTAGDIQADRVGQVRIAITSNKRTVWDGACSVLAKFLERISFREWGKEHVPVEKPSPHAQGICSLKASVGRGCVVNRWNRSGNVRPVRCNLAHHLDRRVLKTDEESVCRLKKLPEGPGQLGPSMAPADACPCCALECAIRSASWNIGCPTAKPLRLHALRPSDRPSFRRPQQPRLN